MVETKPPQRPFFPYDFKVYRWKFGQAPKMHEQIKKAVNQSAGCYPYWFGDSEGITLILGVPSPAFKDQTPRIELSGIELLTEETANTEISKVFSDIDQAASKTAKIAMSRLYDKGFSLAKRTEKGVTDT